MTEEQRVERARQALRALGGACLTCGRGAPRQLAVDIGIGYSTLNRFMTGNRPVGRTAFARIQLYLGDRLGPVRP